MEALQRLERDQAILGLMRKHSLSGPDAASDRFLAQFMVFMVQSCSSAHEMRGRCSLLAEQLPKMSLILLEEALCWKTKQGYEELQYKDRDKESKIATNEIIPLVQNTKVDNTPLVGLNAMERAKSTLEDFCRSYFMFHDLDVHRLETLFKYLPILTFVESYIYQLDGLNEETLHPSVKGRFICQESFKTGQFSPLIALETDPFRPLRSVLEVRGLMTERIDKELRDGVQYWTLERFLCNSVLENKEVSVQDVMRALQFKSFDYRVLNLLLYALTNQQIDECHWSFLSMSELLVEISDDLYDYEEDVLNNTFNVLRMFAKLYGPSKAPSMLAKYISEAEDKYQHLLNQLNPVLASAYQKRCEEAVNEGAKVSAHSMGSWNIPHVISDEEIYRLQQQGLN
ncbi:hypothetical protein SUGI_1028070 [Cryptomeria japonica]|uniref:uncharacterized protein LOC131078956 n=1 Tax=Cryptomeria japonica TaxID=3369 RepID=UPI00241474CD|nr:uncharacterized protein LOC131078956 [Cryptomeria japonica]GLJ48750.1 hypothetical protein SUGI_1028070 [Cryptomeria japonica]